MLFENKVALVNGVGPNIGIEIVAALAEEGANVACMDVETNHAEAAAERARSLGVEALAVAADITDSVAVQKAVDDTVARFGSIDILVSSASITHSGNILNTDLETWRRVVDVTLTGHFIVGQAVAIQMVAQGTGGSIVTVASTSGHRGGPGAIAYAAAKGGILNLTRAMAIQLAPYGIRVNSVTPTQTGVPVAGGQNRLDGPPPKTIPLGRWGAPPEQANAVVFLASDRASFITGTDLPVDGGLMASFPMETT
jgi:NAD(P)-dependent dehydrogenase (short-subunit alcohol dehydrogenase family)